MAMASGNEQSKQLLAILVAYAVVLALLGGAGFAYWLDGRGGLPRWLGSERTSPDKTETAQIEPIPVAQNPDPPSPPVVEPEVTTPAKSEPVQEPAILPPLQTEAHNGDLAASAIVKPEPLTTGPELPPRSVEAEEAEPAMTERAQEPAVPPPRMTEAGNKEPVVPPAKKLEPPTTSCKVDARLWPADRTAQVKVIQTLLRDLGFYSGTTYGTMGPATRAAIGRFQFAANEVETGEATEVLFEALKKKCASPTP
jgi:hypothetical protein